MGSSKDARLAEFTEELKARHLEASPENAEDLFIADQELQQMIDAKLGRAYDPRKIELVSRLQHELHLARIELVSAMQEGRLSRAQYHERFTSQLTGTFAKCQEILGKRDFELLFDATAEEASHLIEPTIFFGTEK